MEHFENFMKSEDFIDFHFYFHCSRNNLYRFNKDKFETTLEYYKHLFKIEDSEKDNNIYLEIFILNDIHIVPKERIKITYSYESEKENKVIKHYNYYKKEINYEEEEDYKYYKNYEEEEELNIKKSLLIFKKSEANVPIVFKKNIRYYNIHEDIDIDNGIMYDYFSGEENESESSESEDIF